MLSKLANRSIHITSFSKLTLRKRILIFILLLLSSDVASYLFIKNDALVVLYIKTLSTITLLYALFNFWRWNKVDSIAFLIFLFFFFKLIIESIFSFGSLLVYPSVLAVIFPFVYVLVIKNVLKKMNVNIIKLLCNSILIFYVLFMLLYGQNFDFSNSTLILSDSGPFSGDTRILHANSIFLIVIPYLFYLNKVLKNATAKSIAGISFALMVILMHQHRTVWLVTILATFLLLSMKRDGKNFLKRIIIITIIIIVLFFLLLTFIPNLNELLIDRFQDIFDPFNEENTGGFRYLQILSYLEYFSQKIFFGWTFTGFNLPNPFAGDNWEEGTGHHFHDAYIEILFYFGITGLLLKYYPLFRIVKQAYKPFLSDNSKILSAFCISGLLYSFSYVPPFVFWGLVGVALYYIERDYYVFKHNSIKHLSQ